MRDTNRVSFYSTTLDTYAGEGRRLDVDLIQTGAERPHLTLQQGDNLITLDGGDVQSLYEVMVQVHRINQTIAFDPKAGE